jgi:hypothetical protein
MGAFSSLMDLSSGNIFMVPQHIVNDLVVKDAGGSPVTHYYKVIFHQ